MTGTPRNRGALRQPGADGLPQSDVPPAATPEDIAASAAGTPQAEQPAEGGQHEYRDPHTGDEGGEDGRGADREPAFRTQADLAEMQATSRSRDLRDELRREREVDNRETEDLSGDDRVAELLQRQWLQTKLPDPPKKAGWHRLWVSLTNSASPPEYFIQLGYRAVKATDWPGFDKNVEKTGEYAGTIRVKEMLLFEIEEAKWQQYMRILHHKVPAEEEEMLRANIQNSFRRDGEEQMIHSIGSGTARLGQTPSRRPVFTE